MPGSAWPSQRVQALYRMRLLCLGSSVLAMVSELGPGCVGAVWKVGTYVEAILGLSETMVGGRRRAGIEVEIMCIKYWGDAWVCKDGMWSINDPVFGHPSAFSCFLETGYGSGCLSWGQTPVVLSACQRAWPQPKHSPHPTLRACSHHTPVGLGLVSLVLPAQGSPTLGTAPFSHQHSRSHRRRGFFCGFRLTHPMSPPSAGPSAAVGWGLSVPVLRSVFLSWP